MRAALSTPLAALAQILKIDVNGVKVDPPLMGVNASLTMEEGHQRWEDVTLLTIPTGAAITTHVMPAQTLKTAANGAKADHL
mmetsp:Transcript_78900/g.92217  ORF Transcript_78900/g.92217 Transcript_78900/m.92217 type:complete len:82 (+) Transcript_78900:258-503(+)